MRWLGVMTTAATISVAATAFAQGSVASADIRWSAPPECPTRAAVLGEVRANLEGSTVYAAHAVDARATVTRNAGRWHVELAIQSDQGSGERSLDAESCAELASAVALIVALAVDPSRRAAPPSPIPDAGPPPSSSLDGGPPTAPTAPTAPNAPNANAPNAPDADAPRASSRDSEAADGPRLALGVAGVADVGAMPALGGGGAATVAALYHRARVEVRGRILGSQHADDPSRPTQGVDLTYLGLDARACFAIIATGRAARDGVAIGPCVGGDVARLSGNGVGGHKTLSGDGSWSSFEGGLLGTWALASIVALRVGADLLVPTSRPAFVVLAPDGTTAASLHRPAALGGRLDLGAELRFW